MLQRLHLTMDVPNETIPLYVCANFESLLRILALAQLTERFRTFGMPDANEGVECK